ncbi:MAG TPA: hypothetical protein VGZ71_09745 [Puia sp.]|nr:hypothetical protein [Puia sp.]
MIEFEKWMEVKEMNQKVVFLMRSIPGCGKTFTAHELLRQHGGTPEGHIFSTDSKFHPVTNKLRALGHITTESLSFENAWQLCEEIKKVWFDARWSKIKADAEDAFMIFKSLADKNKYYEALSAAQQMVDVFETVEYRMNWHGSKLKKAHSDNLAEFKAAVDRGVTPLIVDNTITQAREGFAYARYANDAGYEIRVQEPTSPWWTQHRDLLADKQNPQNREKLDAFAQFLANKNTHGVPLDSIKKMMERWQHNLKPKDFLDAAEK